MPQFYERCYYQTASGQCRHPDFHHGQLPEAASGYRGDPVNIRPGIISIQLIYCAGYKLAEGLTGDPDWERRVSEFQEKMCGSFTLVG